jgi:hypothetical protein
MKPRGNLNVSQASTSGSQPFWLAFFAFLFCIQPLTDLFWFANRLSYHGQNINPASLTGFLFMLIPCGLIFEREKVKILLATSRWFRQTLVIFALVWTYLLIKGTVGGFTENVLIVRILSSVGVCLLIPYFLSSYRLSKIQVAVFIFSVTVIIGLGLAQIGGHYKSDIFDTINSVNISRVTGGYGHPLSLSRVLIFSALILIIRSISRDRNYVGWNFLKTALLFGLIGLLIYRSTYRTGILLIMSLPFLYCLVPGLPLTARFLRTFLLEGVVLTMFWMGSTSYITLPNLFGHSAGVIVNEKTPISIVPPAAVFPIEINLDNKLLPKVAAGERPVSSAVELMIQNTDWGQQLMTVGRGRGFKWTRYAGGILSSGPMRVMFGEKNLKLQTEFGELDEPHNLILMLFYAFGFLGLMLMSVFYYSVWRLTLTFHQNDQQKVLTTAAFLVPLIFGIIAEPLRYPTFFTMLFIAENFVGNIPQEKHRSLIQ